ncbi:hypothetical protein B5C34_14560 [Pacificimonas flava]|uniref:DUF2971 domain-containing protein n=2 Tax=Pacificimonas TaxID=1960290 RepID=A0A219B2G0_9SPHN|nr:MULTISPECIES: hypothetical protein [Pacificimonas]MBZ6380089.1 hypothetical protein [Pacificimonas aurantium]OWV31989.1 hypothetical protein B5C34_14560 [Pacificimonas flava]
MNFLNFEDIDLDEHIYRIMPQNYVFNLFARRENVLSPIHKWKDKFENFQLKLGGVLDSKAFTYGFANHFVGQCWSREAYSEAMWGIYAADPEKRFVRIRSTPRRLLRELINAHPEAAQDRCFLGVVEYKREAALKAWLHRSSELEVSPSAFAKSLLLKRHAFRHEREVRLLYFREPQDQNNDSLHHYQVDPHAMITQIMADPNRDRREWERDKAAIATATEFKGKIKRSKIYDAPDWNPPSYSSN